MIKLECDVPLFKIPVTLSVFIKNFTYRNHIIPPMYYILYLWTILHVNWDGRNFSSNQA